MALENLMTLVINMKDATERMAHMESQLNNANINYTRFDGVNGRALEYPHKDFSAWSYKYLHGRKWSPVELGCYLSHIHCMKQFLESDSEYLLVLEDDAHVPANLIELLDEASEYKQHWDMLRLSTVNSGKWWPAIQLKEDNYLGVCLTMEKGAGAYLVNRKAAKKMTHKLLPMRLAWDIAFDLEWFLGFKTLGLCPLPVKQEGFETQIQYVLKDIKLSNIKYLTVAPFRVVLEITRLMYRTYRLFSLRLFKG